MSNDHSQSGIQIHQVIFRVLLAAAVSTVGIGCSLTGWAQKEVRRVDPALPMTLTRSELVSYINSQHEGLDSWRCTRMKMTAKLPGMPPTDLSGFIACQYPRQFRLTAHNMIAQSDLGSNSERCWFYARPGEPAVVTWRHEDTPLLQRIPTGVPYIDPNWLMLVMGVKPLDEQEYFLSEGPTGSRQLWLTAIEETPGGRAIRRTIKVDTVEGVIREHVVQDSEANVVVRASLSKHRSFQGNLIPGKVKLEFPQMDSEITLSFRDIEVNPDLPRALWSMPQSNKNPTVDLGDLIRHQLRKNGLPVDNQYEMTAEVPHERSPREAFAPNETRIRLEQPKFFDEPDNAVAEAPEFSVTESESSFVDEPDWSESSELSDEPDWADDSQAFEPNPFTGQAPIQRVNHESSRQDLSDKNRSGFDLW